MKYFPSAPKYLWAALSRQPASEIGFLQQEPKQAVSQSLILCNLPRHPIVHCLRLRGQLTLRGAAESI